MLAFSRMLAAPLAVLVLLGSGCASAPRLSPEQRAAELLTSRPPPAGRLCVISPTPAALPQAGELVDVEALRADLNGVVEPDPRGQRYALFSMGYDRFGSNIRRALIEHNLGASVADSVQALVFKHRRSVEEAEEDWGLRMRIAFAEEPTFAVGRQELCEPRPRDNSVGQAILTESTFGTTTRVRNGRREHRLWVRLLVGPQGTVKGAKIERGIVTSSHLEYQIYNHVRSLFFEPATADGIPVDGSISIPVFVLAR
jgi:hypothetical protein